MGCTGLMVGVRRRLSLAGVARCGGLTAGVAGCVGLMVEGIGGLEMVVAVAGCGWGIPGCDLWVVDRFGKWGVKAVAGCGWG